MGARTNFVKAMLIGVVIGVVITIAVFQLRGDASLSAAAKSNDPCVVRCRAEGGK